MRRRKYPWKQADILIHRYCRRLTTGQRLAVIAVAFALFMAGCLYMILSSLSVSENRAGDYKLSISALWI